MTKLCLEWKRLLTLFAMLNTSQSEESEEILHVTYYFSYEYADKCIFLKILGTLPLLNLNGVLISITQIDHWSIS